MAAVNATGVRLPDRLRRAIEVRSDRQRPPALDCDGKTILGALSIRLQDRAALRRPNPRTLVAAAKLIALGTTVSKTVALCTTRLSIL